MFRFVMGCIVGAGLLLPTAAGAEPITLKLSFFTSDRSNIYQFSIKPVVDAINAEGQGLIHVDVDFSGGPKSQTKTTQALSDGLADMALVIPGYQPDLFPDSGIMELPGLYQNADEASRVFTWLVDNNALAGYANFFVVGAFVSEGESIHSRKPVASLADLKGQKIRTNNSIETETLKMLGAIPVVLPINQTTDALSQGKIDGATVPPAMLFEFGIGRVTSHHYMLHLGGAPTALVMNRKKFDSLPPAAQTIIRKYSGKWLSELSASAFDAKNREILKQLQADARRSLVFPSPEDRAASQRLFDGMIETWAALRPHNRDLLAKVKRELATLRAAE